MNTPHLVRTRDNNLWAYDTVKPVTVLSSHSVVLASAPVFTRNRSELNLKSRRPEFLSGLWPTRKLEVIGGRAHAKTHSPQNLFYFF